MGPPTLLHPFARPTAERFVPIVRGEGAAVFDADGRRYVDGLASLWYCNVGHGRAEIVDAVTQQNSTPTRRPTGPPTGWPPCPPCPTPGCS